MGSFSMSVKWQGVGDGFIWASTGVYGPNDNSVRGQMWDELVGIQQYWDIPWFCIGISTLFVFRVKRGVVLVLLRLWKNFQRLLRI